MDSVYKIMHSDASTSQTMEVKASDINKVVFICKACVCYSVQPCVLHVREKKRLSYISRGRRAVALDSECVKKKKGAGVFPKDN